VTGVHLGCVRQLEEHLRYRAQQRFVVAAGKIRAADGAVEQRVARKYKFFSGKVQGNPTRRVPRRGHYFKFHAAEGVFAHGDVLRRKRGNGGEAPHAALGGFCSGQAIIVGADVDRRAAGFVQGGNAVNMIEVAVGDANTRQVQIMGRKIFQHRGGVAAHVHGNGLRTEVDDVAIGLQWSKRKRGNRHDSSF